jgi:hypothetical protein
MTAAVVKKNTSIVASLRFALAVALKIHDLEIQPRNSRP